MHTAAHMPQPAFDEATRCAFALCDDLRRDHDLESANNGVTIVVL